MVVCPTITANNTHQYREQIERVSDFAKEIHIDVMDGKFTKSISPGVSQLWWPDGVKAQIHLMVECPAEIIEHVIELNPSTVIVHAEADMNQVLQVLTRLSKTKIKSGVALLAESDPEQEDIYGMLSLADQALIFGGNLGYQGGNADLKNLSKVKKIKEYFPGIVVAWDGGVNDENISKILKSGIDIVNVGSFIQKSKDPKKSYKSLINFK